MRLMLAALLLAALPAFTLAVPAAAPTLRAPTAPTVPMERVALETSAGRIVLELDPGKAPQTVANFLAYVESGHYNGTVFHRVVPNLLVQGGAFTPDLQPKPERAPVPLEAGNGLSNLRGTIAAARRPDTRDSATAQFFINVVDNPQFDPVDPANDIGAGYAVFGRVVEGMDVVDAMRKAETGAQGPFPSRVPNQAIVIERALRLPGTAQ
ncbi:peptidylprolyl isomerase [Silanimonas sp.]|jgi:cyclophilin family peptidyl-prolyl cis-trans isomerase|uniref:peptidylprolyl isomerase n=1 Tax=Silanimonas sp. TaxID=1929290 RepID=UPI0037CBD409